MTVKETEEVFHRLRRQFPDAIVVAINLVGLITEMPPLLGSAANVPDRAHAAADLVGKESRSAVVSQFLHVPVGGRNHQILKDRSGGEITCFVFDLTAAHGVVVMAIVAGVEQALETDPFVYVATLATPRYSRFVRDREARVIEADTALSIILGFSINEIQEQNIISFIHPDDRNRAIASWYEAVFKETGGHVRWRARVRTKKNRWRWVEFTDTNYLRMPVYPHIVTEMLDIDAEMLALEDLYTSTELLARLTDALPVGVLHFDTELNLTFVNHRLSEMLDLPSQNDLRVGLSRFHPDDQPRIVEAVMEALKGNDLDRTARLCLSSSGPALHLKLAFRALRDRQQVVSGVVVTVADVTAEVLRRNDLELRATYDALTGCLNRDSIFQAINDELSQVNALSGGLAVLFADLDGFKAVNDKLGHIAGDDLLRTVSSKINGAVRANDKVGRVGGDEFVVLCPDLAEPTHALEVAARVISAIQEVPVDRYINGSLSASVGVVWTQRPGLTAESVVSAADYAMYTAKRSVDKAPILVEI